MNDGHLVVGYHGCDITTRDKLIRGLATPQESKNAYDWLGPGFYFFENDIERAMHFAVSSHENPDRLFSAKPIATPAVVGCVLSVQRCLDMTTRVGLEIFGTALDPAVSGIEGRSGKVPKNEPSPSGDPDVLLRRLDNAVITFIHELRDKTEGQNYQAVRGAFQQGAALAENSGFHRDSHIQISLRDFSCIRGWFLPAGQPAILSDLALQEAEDALAAFKLRHPKPKRKG